MILGGVIYLSFLVLVLIRLDGVVYLTFFAGLDLITLGGSAVLTVGDNILPELVLITLFFFDGLDLITLWGSDVVIDGVIDLITLSGGDVLTGNTFWQSATIYKKMQFIIFIRILNNVSLISYCTRQYSIICQRILIYYHTKIPYEVVLTTSCPWRHDWQPND